jgi:hypothetical protein
VIKGERLLIGRMFYELTATWSNPGGLRKTRVEQPF